jgi:hypothetical protein
MCITNITAINYVISSFLQDVIQRYPDQWTQTSALREKQTHDPSNITDEFLISLANCLIRRDSSCLFSIALASNVVLKANRPAVSESGWVSHVT